MAAHHHRMVRTGKKGVVVTIGDAWIPSREIIHVDGRSIKGASGNQNRPGGSVVMRDVQALEIPAFKSAILQKEARAGIPAFNSWSGPEEQAVRIVDRNAIPSAAGIPELAVPHLRDKKSAEVS